MMNQVSIDEQRQIEAFIYKEARLADESRYAEWEDLVDDDMYYWVPVFPEADPSKDVSLLADNRKRLATRIAQLKTGERHAQVPPSVMRRLISNIEIEKVQDPKKSGSQEYKVGANFVLYEFRAAANRIIEVWPGRVEYGIRKNEKGDFKMFLKKVMLVHASEGVASFAFIL